MSLKARLIYEAEVASYSPASCLNFFKFCLRCQNVNAALFKVDQENSKEKRHQLCDFLVFGSFLLQVQHTRKPTALLINASKSVRLSFSFPFLFATRSAKPCSLVTCSLHANSQSLRTRVSRYAAHTPSRRYFTDTATPQLSTTSNKNSFFLNGIFLMTN